MEASNDEILKYKNDGYKVVYASANKYFTAMKDDFFDKLYFVLPVDKTLKYENIIVVRLTLGAAIKEADFLQKIRQLIMGEEK